MAKSGSRQPPPPEGLHQLTVRIPRSLEKRLEAMSFVTGRSYKDLVESALEDYMDRLKLDVKTVAEIGGWADIKVLQKYLHPTAAQTRAAVETIALFESNVAPALSRPLLSAARHT